LIFRKSDGIVIGGINYSETSRIVKVYTRDYGKLSLMAKGARRRKSIFRGALETFNIIEAVFILGKKELHTLAECYLYNDFQPLKRKLERLAAAYRMAALVDETQPVEDPNPIVYNLLRGTLVQLDCRKNFQPLTPAFQLRLLELSGFLAPFETCQNCGRNLGARYGGGVYYSGFHNGMICGGKECRTGWESIEISAGSFALMRKLFALNIELVHGLRLSRMQIKEIDLLLQNMFENALERKPRAVAIIDELAHA